MRRRRTVPNEKGREGLYCGGKSARAKTISLLRLLSLNLKLSSGVWKNRSLSLQSWKHAEETLMMERRPLGDLSRANVSSVFQEEQRWKSSTHDLVPWMSISAFSYPLSATLPP